LVVNVLDAYSGSRLTHELAPDESIDKEWSLKAFHGWYDLVVTVEQDASFERRLAGHLETGRDSYSDPALGGLVTLKA
jgi:phospholipase C